VFTGDDEPVDPSWPPITAAEPSPSPPFPVHVFPEPLREYCLEVAQAICVPVDFVAVAMLVAASAAIGRSVALMVKRS
jgi:hypothetical protein